MEVLTPLAPPIEGLVSPPQNQPIVAPGTYSLRQIDPRDLSGIARITSLQGIWRPYTDPTDPTRSLILNVSQFECFTLPHGEDNEKQEMLFIARDLAGNITDMYFGEVNFDDGTFAAWPIENVDDGDPSNEVDGVVTDYVYRSGIPSPTFKDIRSATFAFTTGTIPSTFQSSGNLLVVRL